MLASILPGFDEKFGVPNFVKEAKASALTCDGYPSGTQADIWLSALKAHYTLSDDELNCKLAALQSKAADFSPELLCELDRLQEIFDNQKTAEERAEDYAIFSSEEKWGPVRNPDEWDQAETWLGKYAYAIDRQRRLALASLLIRKATGFHKEASDSLYFHAERAFTDPDLLMREIDARKKLTGSTELNPLFLALGKRASCGPLDWEPSDVQQILETFDKDHRMDMYYGTRLKMPHKIAYSLSEKKAVETLSGLCHLVNGSVYKLPDFDKLNDGESLVKLAALFGDDFVEAITDAFGCVDTEKAAEVISTLPRGDADLFDSVMAKEAGCKPYLTLIEETSDSFGELLPCW